MRKDYLAEARTQPQYKNVYQELTEKIEGSLEKIIRSVLGKMRNRTEITDETFRLFFG